LAFLFYFFCFCSIWHWQVYLPCPASGGTLFYRKKGGKTTKGAAAPLETLLVRNGGCGCLVSVILALLEISVPKFPLTQRSPPPPACLLRVTNRCADSAPARAPSTLVRWRIEHLHVQLANIVGGGPCVKPHVCRIDNMNGQDNKACPYIFCAFCMLDALLHPHKRGARGRAVGTAGRHP